MAGLEGVRRREDHGRRDGLARRRRQLVATRRGRGDGRRQRSSPDRERRPTRAGVVVDRARWLPTAAPRDHAMKGLLAALLLLLALPAAAAAEPQPFERGSWSALREAHAGRPMVVHLWGLTCAPCLVELPRWETVRRRVALPSWTNRGARP